MTTPPKRGRGQPRKEPTKQIRVYTADVPLLCRNGETQAEAVRRLLIRCEPKPAAKDDGTLWALRKKKLSADIFDTKTGMVLAAASRPLTIATLKNIAANKAQLGSDDPKLLSAILVRITQPLATHPQTGQPPNTSKQ